MAGIVPPTSSGRGGSGLPDCMVLRSSVEASPGGGGSGRPGVCRASAKPKRKKKMQRQRLGKDSSRTKFAGSHSFGPLSVVTENSCWSSGSTYPWALRQSPNLEARSGQTGLSACLSSAGQAESKGARATDIKKYEKTQTAESMRRCRLKLLQTFQRCALVTVRGSIQFHLALFLLRRLHIHFATEDHSSPVYC